MIVTMKKLVLLLHHSDRDALLKELQNLGLVHVEELAAKDVALLQKRQNALKEVQQVLAALPPADDKQLKALPAPKLSLAEYAAIVADYQESKQRLNEISGELAQRQKEAELAAPWGDYDPQAFARLGAAGIKLNCYVLREEFFAAFAPEGNLVEVINRAAGLVYFISDAAIEAIPHAEKIILPALNPQELQAAISDLQSRQQEQEAKLNGFAAKVPELCRYQALLHDDLSFADASLDLESLVGGHILQLAGYFPAAGESQIRELLDKQTVWYEISETAAEDDVPIKFKNNKYNKLFLPITEIYQLPDYGEVETTPFLAPFFTLFFGLCLGDVGYGLLVTLIGLIGLFKTKGSMRSIMGLVNILGLSTMACGFLLNGFFGQPIFGPGGFFPDVNIPLLSSYDQGWMSTGLANGRTTYPAMSFALLVGFVQLCLGMIINMVNAWRQDGFVYALRPLSSLFMFVGLILWWAAVPDFMNMPDLNPGKFGLGEYNIGIILTWAPSWLGMALTAAGVALLLFFGNPDKKFFIRPAIGLYDLYSFITGIMGDLLSYIRLFALGLGGGLVGASFNQLGLMLITGESGDINWATPLAIFTVLIIVLGHAINFALSLVGSFVHPLRLTFVEFYKNLGFKGGGRPYQPLSVDPLNKNAN